MFGDEPERKGKNGKMMLESSRMFWGGMGQIASVVQVFFGILVLMAAQKYLMHSGRTTGRFVGLGSIALGLAGWFGNRRQKPQYQALFVFGMGFLGLITFEFIGQVGRDVEIHCNFAESYARISHLEEKVTSLKHDEMITTIFTRLNEMDDLLNMVESGTVDRLELRHKQQDLAGQDLRYIKSKIHALQHHADEVLDHIYEQAKNLDETGKGDPAVIEHQKEMRKNLETHLDNVEAVLNHVQDVEKNGRELTYEEYELLFNALLSGHSESESLKNEQLHLPWVKAAWERKSADEYHKYDLTQASNNIKNIEMHRKAQRDKFEEEFMNTMSAHPKMNKKFFDDSLVETLEDLPEHCLSEMKHLKYIRLGCWMLILAQLASSYISVTSMIIWTQKKDF